VLHSVPEDYKKNPGAVEAIAEQPGHPDNILIGYNRGLMVLWNKATPGAQQVSLYIHYICTYTQIHFGKCNSHAVTLTCFSQNNTQCGSVFNPASSFISDTIEFKLIIITFFNVIIIR